MRGFTVADQRAHVVVIETERGSQASAAAASRLGSRPLVEPSLTEVLLDCGDVPVGGLRPHGGRREGGDG